MPGNSIEASFGLDLGPLKRDFAQAESIAKNGAGKVQGAMANAVKANVAPSGSTRESISRYIANEQRQIQDFIQHRSASGRRIRTARDFAPAPAGKYKSPAEQIKEEEALSPAQMLRGIGRGATALLVLREVAQFYEKANAEAGELTKRMLALTQLTGAGAFRGISEMEMHLKESTALINDIQKRKTYETKNDILGGMVPGSGQWFGKAYRFVRQKMSGESDLEELQRVKQLREGVSEDISSMGEKQRTLNAAERESISGSEELAAILKEQITHREKMGELARMEAAAGVHNAAALNAEKERHEQILTVIHRRAVAEREIMGIERANLYRTRTGSGVAPLAARAQNLRDRMKEIARQMGGPLSDVQQSKLINERSGLQSDLDQMLLEGSRQSPAERTAAKNKALQDARDLKRLKDNKGLIDVHRNMSGNVIGGTDPISGERVVADSESGGRRMDWELSKHMAAPGHMMPYSGSPEFQKAFGAETDKTGNLGTAGVLDRIEKNTANLGANR